MNKRKLGNTGLQTSLIGFGGFHLVETAYEDASRLLNRYLDLGGNYIETAPGYGDGRSEQKIGRAVSSRRDEFILASKNQCRKGAGVMELLERSLKYLKTGHLDIIFLHAMQRKEELEQVLGSDGALEQLNKAKKQGKVRHIGITGHGRPRTLIDALKLYDFEVLMTGMNYFDRFNFPMVEDELIPLAGEKGCGLLAMKSLGDGYLYHNAGEALRFSLGLPVSSVVLGINNMAMLEEDIALAEAFQPMSTEEKEVLFREAPELGDYVCRLCGKCVKEGFDPQEIFLLEGLYDRQMDNKVITDTALMALRERLKGWFQQTEEAREEYSKLENKVDTGKDYSALNNLCPYNINIERKLKIAHEKLSDKEYIF